MVKYFDVTLPITDRMMVYPGDEPCIFRRTHTIAKDGYNWSTLSCGTHLGTHIDVPRHFIKDGRTLDEFPFELMVGKVEVVEIDDSVIDRNALERANIENWNIVFFKTRNQRLWNLPKFSKEYVSLDAGAAEILVDKKCRMVGIDYKSIEEFDSHDYPVHKILLAHDVFIIEGLYLNDVPPGCYRLHCLPLKLHQADGAPVRVILEL